MTKAGRNEAVVALPSLMLNGYESVFHEKKVTVLYINNRKTQIIVQFISLLYVQWQAVTKAIAFSLL